jgi:hypothetical protein
MHNEEFHDLYSSPKVIRVIKSSRITYMGLVAGVGRKRNVSTIIRGKPDGKNRFERPRHRWDKNNKTDRGQTERKSVDQIHVSLDRGKRHASVKAVMKRPGSIKHRKFLTF